MTVFLFYIFLILFIDSKGKKFLIKTEGYCLFNIFKVFKVSLTNSLFKLSIWRRIWRLKQISNPTLIMETLKMKVIVYLYIWCFDKFHVEVEPKDVHIETSIESTFNSGDYSSSPQGCSFKLICKTINRNDRIKAGSCKFM